MAFQHVVVIGQGYVGLPLAEAATTAGLQVTGLDTNLELIDQLRSGTSHIDDVSDADTRRMFELGYSATNDPNCISSADVVVITVPTPLADDGGPDLSAVLSATRTTAEYLKPGTLVILESTSYPGTTEEVVLPILETSGLDHGHGFLLAFSPERVDPGNGRFAIRNTPKLVGGVLPEATVKATAFYSHFVTTVVPMNGAKEAELAKLLENTYRHVNIALVNEMARFCHDMQIDIWEVIRGAATKPFGFQQFTPGPGVGGHCIPIDPNYLSHQVRKTLGYQFRFVELAQEINSSMPSYVAQRIADLLNDQGRALRDAQVLLLGVTYKPDISDQRESPAIPLARILLRKGAKVLYNDPFVPSWSVDGQLLHSSNLEDSLALADVAVLLQNHSAYDLTTITDKTSFLLDTRGATMPGTAARL